MSALLALCLSLAASCDGGMVRPPLPLENWEGRVMWCSGPPRWHCEEFERRYLDGTRVRRT